MSKRKTLPDQEPQAPAPVPNARPDREALVQCAREATWQIAALFNEVDRIGATLNGTRSEEDVDRLGAVAMAIAARGEKLNGLVISALDNDRIKLAYARRIVTPSEAEAEADHA
jgi:hypothetical protein